MGLSGLVKFLHVSSKYEFSTQRLYFSHLSRNFLTLKAMEEQNFMKFI